MVTKAKITISVKFMITSLINTSQIKKRIRKAVLKPVVNFSWFCISVLFNRLEVQLKYLSQFKNDHWSLLKTLARSGDSYQRQLQTNTVWSRAIEAMIVDVVNI